jgi:hypothetical protein
MWLSLWPECSSLSWHGHLFHPEFIEGQPRGKTLFNSTTSPFSLLTASLPFHGYRLLQSGRSFQFRDSSLLGLIPLAQGSRPKVFHPENRGSQLLLFTFSINVLTPLLLRWLCLDSLLRRCCSYTAIPCRPKKCYQAKHRRKNHQSRYQTVLTVESPFNMGWVCGHKIEHRAEKTHIRQYRCNSHPDAPFSLFSLYIVTLSDKCT